MKAADKYNRAVRAVVVNIFNGYEIKIKTAYSATLIELSYKAMIGLLMYYIITLANIFFMKLARI